MKFGKWIVKLFISLKVFVLILCLFNYVIDPFGVFGDKFLKWYSYNMINNQNIAKISYLDQFHDHYDSYIIGGSPSSSLSPELLNKYYSDAKFYSMLMNERDFSDYEKTLYYLVENYHVKHMILHVSLNDLAQHRYDSSNVKEYLHAKVSGDSLGLFYTRFLTLNPKYGLAKLKEWVKSMNEPMEFADTDLGAGVYHKAGRDSEKLNDLEYYLARHPEFTKPKEKMSAARMDQNIASVKRMKEYCEKRGIYFTVVTGAAYYTEVDRYNTQDLKTYWRKLAAVTDFWDFSGYNTISQDPRHFYDPTHYRDSVGQMMMACMFGDNDVYVPKNFCHYTTRRNVDEHIEKVFKKPQNLAVSATEEKKVPIITYHHIVTDKNMLSASITSLDKFKEDMLALKQAGYQTVFLKDLIDYVETGKELPERPVVVTLDDGYLSNYQYAYPVLKELGMKATISVIGWSVGQTKYRKTDKDIIPHFTWQQARDMYESGLIDIQSHTYDMHNTNEAEFPFRRGVLQNKDELSGSYYIALAQDVRKIQSLIEKHVGNQVLALTYPMGEYSFLSEQILAELGYKVTLTTKHGVNTIKKGQPQTLFAMKRINADPNIASEDLIEMLGK
ncbi:polysaccharide deacetylase family protein [Brevibacillus borstelensis]|uniref:polysaccharide deacetylase family protein n=1 Tax=Brevibacillus borstelensis TaxID=45462 RepID=UPI0030C4FF54